MHLFSTYYYCMFSQQITQNRLTHTLDGYIPTQFVYILYIFSFHFHNPTLAKGITPDRQAKKTRGLLVYILNEGDHNITEVDVCVCVYGGRMVGLGSMRARNRGKSCTLLFV